VMEAFWAGMKDPATHTKPAPTVVRRLPPGSRLGKAPEYDVAVAGGTLGIMLALALQVGAWVDGGEDRWAQAIGQLG
jgi:hypothetical protein